MVVIVVVVALEVKLEFDSSVAGSEMTGAIVVVVVAGAVAAVIVDIATHGAKAPDIHGQLVSPQQVLLLPSSHPVAVVESHLDK